MKAHVEWDGYMWVAVVEDYGNVVTQAKRLEQIASRLSEAMRLMTGKSLSPDDWFLEVHLDKHKALAAEAAELKIQRAEVEATQEDLARRTAKVARKLRKLGFSLRDIGAMTGVSYQRAHQLVG